MARAEAGEDVVIRRGTTAVVRLVPVSDPSPPPRSPVGALRGRIVIADDADELGPEWDPYPLTQLLLDTHPLLWALAGDGRLPAWLAEELDDDPSRFGVSDVTIWEIGIKRSTGKLEVPDDLPQIVEAFRFSRVPLERRQAWAVRSMPRHHDDPFDRLLLAQAQDLGIRS